MVRSMSARLASISSELPASCSLVALPDESILMTCATICNGFPFSTLQTFSASSGFPSDRHNCHSAKLISCTFLVLSRSEHCSAGVGGTYFVIVKPAGGRVVVACRARWAGHPPSLPWYLTYLLLPNLAIGSLPAPCARLAARAIKK